MANAKTATITLRNGEKRVYKDVTRIDDSRRHLVLVYVHDVLVAQLNKHDVVQCTLEEPATVSETSAETATTS